MGLSEVVVVKRKVRIEEATADFGFVGAERFWEASNTVAADASVAHQSENRGYMWGSRRATGGFLLYLGSFAIQK